MTSTTPGPNSAMRETRSQQAVVPHWVDGLCVGRRDGLAPLLRRFACQVVLLDCSLSFDVRFANCR